MKNTDAPSVANAQEKGQMQGVAAVAGGFGSFSREEILRLRRERDMNPPPPFSDQLRALADEHGMTPAQLGSSILEMDEPNSD